MADSTSYMSVSQALSGHLADRASGVLSEAGATRDKAKIEKAGRDFEAILLTNWLQQAEQSFAKVPGTDEEEESECGSEQYMSLGMEALGTAMAASGGIGIGKMITSQLYKSAEKEASPAAVESQK